MIISNSTQSGSRGSDGVRAPCLRSDPDQESKQKKKIRGKRGGGRGKKRRAGARRKQLKTDRLFKSNVRVLYWNCGSLNVRAATAEKLAYESDIFCLQETQRHVIKPKGFAPPVCNDIGLGQLILVRKEISHKKLDLSRWHDILKPVEAPFKWETVSQ